MNLTLSCNKQVTAPGGIRTEKTWAGYTACDRICVSVSTKAMQSPPPYQRFHCVGLSFPAVNRGVAQEVHGDWTLPMCPCHSPHITSPRRHSVTSPRHKKWGGHRTRRYIERETHIHTMFITLCGYKRSILLLVVLGNLFPGLIYILNFATGLYAQEKPSVCGVWYCPGCRLPRGSWNVSPQV